MNPDGMMYSEGGDDHGDIILEDGGDPNQYASPEEY